MNATELATLNDYLASALSTCNDTLSVSQYALDVCGCNATSPVPPSVGSDAAGSTACTGSGAVIADEDYDLALHVGSVFIVLVIASLGVSLPVLAARTGRLGVDGYWIQLGKLVGTGIVLACGLIHMLQPAAAALTNECVPSTFSEDYPAYAYLFSLLAALGLHCFDTVLRLHLVESWSQTGSSAESSIKSADAENHAKLTVAPGAEADASLGLQLTLASHDLIVRRVVQSYSMEFAFTVHSIFIGLTVGVVAREELEGLLPALVFHQFFEGIALGSRLADAELPAIQAALFAVVFAVSAPVGIACGIVYVVSVNPDGAVYSLVQGTFDGVCAGFLLYVGFQLLLTDFPVDMAVHANATKPRYKLRRVGMFLAVWVGAGFMALIGRYL